MTLLSNLQSDNPIVQTILGGGAPTTVRLAAARGALPIPAEELLHLLYFLSADDENDVCEAVEKTMVEFADSDLARLLQAPSTPAPLLNFIALRSIERPETIQRILLHPAVPDATVTALATRVDEAALDLIVTNQERLIRVPALLDAILSNSRITADLKRRVDEIREEFFTKKALAEKLRAAQEAEAELADKMSEEELERLVEKELEAAKAELAEGRLKPSEEDKSKEPPSEEEEMSALQRIAAMSVPKRIRLALRGTRTDRSILIRDSNRLVATTVMKSPKMSESEVELIANMRNVQEEVLRILGTSRTWLRSYSIVHTMVKNPRTPIPIALNLISRLNHNDLKKLAGNRNIPEALRKQAKMMVDRAAKRAGGRH